MLRVRLGNSWKQDPTLRAALGRGGAEAGAAIREAIDSFAIEVDGVDVCMGQAEGPVVSTTESLAIALLELLDAERPRVHVSFTDADLELVIGRRGASALLSVVSLRRPARVVARDVEVDLSELISATREAARALEQDLRALHARALAAEARSLTTLARRLDEAPPVPSREEYPPPSPPPDPDRAGAPPLCAFELGEDRSAFASYRGPGADLGSLLVPGRVVLRARDGGVIAAAENPPFLVLRDLVAFAGQVAAAVRGDGRASIALPAQGRRAVIQLQADLQAGTVSRDGTAFECPPLRLAHAACDAAIELVERIVAQNPDQERNGWVSTLRSDAQEREAQLEEILAGDLLAPTAAAVRQRRTRSLPRTPLGPGHVRRVVFRRAWTADVGTPVPGALAHREGIVLAAGERGVVALDPGTGDERWRRPDATAAWMAETLFVASPNRIVALDAATGRERGGVDLAQLPHGAVRAVQRIAGGAALAEIPGALAAFDPASGHVTWTFTPPAALALRATAFGPLALAASDTGLLYGLDAATGRPRWRVHLPGRLVGPPTAFGDACIALCETDLGGSLVALDPATGRRRYEVPLDVTPTGSPVPFAGLLGVPGAVAGDALVTAVDPAGRLAWEDATALGSGAVALAALPSALLAKTADGACAALDRTGAAIWARPARSGQLAPANPAPVIARGIALVPSEEVEAVEVRSGALLGAVPLGAPIELACDESLNAWGIDADGLVTAVRLETHLSLIRS